MQNICKEWQVTNDEYLAMDEQFGRLAEKQAWNLLSKNYKNSHTEDQVDIAQEMRIAMLRAGAYHKRQTYIEASFDLCQKYVKGKFHKMVIAALLDCWENKIRHGANRQKFGPNQEVLLSKFLRLFVPKNQRPDKKAPLQINAKFITYCKSITWNHQKALGKRITREKSLRTGISSLSEYDYLASI